MVEGMWPAAATYVPMTDRCVLPATVGVRPLQHCCSGVQTFTTGGCAASLRYIGGESVRTYTYGAVIWTGFEKVNVVTKSQMMWNHQ